MPPKLLRQSSCTTLPSAVLFRLVGAAGAPSSPLHVQSSWVNAFQQFLRPFIYECSLCHQVQGRQHIAESQTRCRATPCSHESLLQNTLFDRFGTSNDLPLTAPHGHFTCRLGSLAFLEFGSLDEFGKTVPLTSSVLGFPDSSWVLGGESQVLEYGDLTCLNYRPA